MYTKKLFLLEITFVITSLIVQRHSAVPDEIYLPVIIRKAKVTSHHMFQKSGRRFFRKRKDHFTLKRNTKDRSNTKVLAHMIKRCYQNHGHVAKTIVGLTNIIQSSLVQQDLLENERGHGFGKLRTSLHDSKAKRDDLGGEEEIDHFLLIGLDQGPDHAQAGQTEIFEGSGLGDGMKERVKVQRDVSQQESRSRVGMRSHALKQSQRVANPGNLDVTKCY